MFAVPEPVAVAVEVLPPLLDPAPLRDALRLWGAPWRLAVVGRVGVGKSTLVNLLAGERVRPVGLGGVTRDEAEVALPGGAVVDTVGIDDEAGALARLCPLLEQVDAAIWVVDGLQPLTATERRVIDAALPPGTPLHVVVSKLDLADDDEAPRVLQRVERLTAHLAPGSVRRLDLRALDRAPDDLAAPTRRPPPRRARPVFAALDALQARLDAIPAPPSREGFGLEIRARWADHVRAAERSVDALVSSGAVDNKVLALERLRRAAEAARDDFLAALDADAPDDRVGRPDLPLPDPPDAAPLKQVVAAMSGVEGARRALRAAAARWLAEGEVALLDWLDAQDDLDAAHQQRTRVQDALSRARLALS